MTKAVKCKGMSSGLLKQTMDTYKLWTFPSQLRGDANSELRDVAKAEYRSSKIKKTIECVFVLMTFRY